MNKARPWLEGAGLSLLYLLPLTAAMLSPSRMSIYHQLLPATTVMRGLLIDLIAQTVLIACYFMWLRTKHHRLRDLLELPVLFVLSWVLARDIGFTTRLPSLHLPIQFLEPALPYLPGLVLVVSVIVMFSSPKTYRGLSAGSNVMLAAFGFAAVFVLAPRVVLACFSKQPQEQPSFVHMQQNGLPRHHPRIVWVLFDELSFNQVFDHRDKEIQLPAFDELQAQSISFSHLSPVGYFTDKVVPSLFLGKQIVDTRVTADGNLRWRSGPGDKWQIFDPRQTIFGEAQNLGWSPGLAGWFNPYCRLLGPVLNRCVWMDGTGLIDGLFEGVSTRQSSLVNAFYGLPLVSPWSLQSNDKLESEGHYQDYKQLLDAGKTLLRDPSIDLAFLHLPIPHPPGIYKRPGTDPLHAPSYLDNLVLADGALAELRKIIAETPEGQDTVLIVSSDHSWRVPLWRDAEDWSQEDERASGKGSFDDRPVLMLHYPKETTAAVVDGKTSAMAVHTLLDGLLTGTIANEAELREQAQVQVNAKPAQ